MKNTVTESLISTLKRKAVSKQSPAEIATEMEFLRAYYHRLSKQDFDVRQSLAFRDVALTHRNLGSSRKPRETIVVLYNFSATEPGRLAGGNAQEKTIINIILDDQPFVINSLLMKLNG